MIQTRYKTNKVYLYLLLLAAFFIVLKVWRGIMVTSGEQGGIWNYIQLLWVFTGIACLLSGSKSFMSFPCVKLYILFSLYIWLLALLSFDGELNSSNIFRFLVVPYGVLTLLTFYSVGYKADIRQYSVVLSVTFLVISLMMFTTWRSFSMAILNYRGAIADVYYAVGLLPLILLYTPSKYKIVPFLIASIVVIMSSKRGALIALVLMLIAYFFMNVSKKGKRSSLFLRIFILCFVLIVIFYTMIMMVEQYDLNMFDRMEKLEYDGGSGRIDRWANIQDIFSGEINGFHLLFGHGNGTIVKEVGGHAHNDFLEFLYEYGLFAFVLYVSFSC